MEELLDNNIKGKSIFDVYTYYIEFSLSAFVMEEKINFFFDGRQITTNNHVFQFDSMYQLSIEDIPKIFEGTTGIYSFSGDFKGVGKITVKRKKSYRDIKFT